MIIPEKFEIYQSQAQELIRKNSIQDIIFSGSTYQILVYDPDTKEDYWTFIQLDSGGHPKDHFCSCGETESSCPHVVAALLTIFKEHRRPLHQRFTRSLWNQICRICCFRNKEYASELIEEKSGCYICKRLDGKEVFRIQGKDEKSIEELKSLIEEHPLETEETSIKFINLQPEEIARWKEGEPSPNVIYLLSYWNDLAKYLMLKQENHELKSVQFGYRFDGLPESLHILFDSISLTFYMEKNELDEIIPSFATVPCTLKIHDDPREFLKKMRYDQEKGELEIVKKSQEDSEKESDKPQKTAIDCGKWWFLKQDGFYKKDQQNGFKEGVLKDDEIAKLLNEYYPVVEALLEGAQAHEEPVEPKYVLNFDEKYHLNIQAYLFIPGDLQLPHSRKFRNWVYLQDDGFYRLRDSYFQALSTVVPVDKMMLFINQNKAWLNTQKGFEIHVTSVESRIEYRLDDKENLVFIRLGEDDHGYDFDQWIYLENEGFYPKARSYISLPYGQKIQKSQIPLFVRNNRSDLELVPNFFSKFSPVERTGLNVELTEENEIVINPKIDLKKEFKDKELHLFEEFIYLEGVGFSELSGTLRIPEKYSHPVIIQEKHLRLFLESQINEINHMILDIDSRLIKPEEVRLVAKEIIKSEKKGYYELQLKYQTENGKIILSDIWNAIHRKKEYLFSPYGMIDLEMPRFKWMRHLQKKQLNKKSNKLTLSTLEILKLIVFEDIQFLNSKSTKSSQQILDQLIKFHYPERPNLKGLKSDLRNYQEHGLEWLWFLYHHGLSGLLCDDMGLGKTHQAMALIAAIENDQKKLYPNEKRHYLIICPTSVIYHWKEKLESFLPSFRVCTYHGQKRSFEEFTHEYEILLTSYGIWRNESGLLGEVPFEIAIFDEVQMAKNRSSRIHQALMHHTAKMRVGLTGTPIENYLSELKALFDLIIPGYMLPSHEFHLFFSVPIEKQGNIERRLILSRFINPFILRRKKEDVLKDLPKKIIDIAHCELAEEQATLYNHILTESKKAIIQELKKEKGPIPYIHIFSILSNLKQICNHPATYLKCPTMYKKYKSGKWELFVDLMTEARNSKQKVVVFSQYLAMLDIIQMYLEENEISFAAVRGSTVDRQKQINMFNQDPGCEVFVGSLQAVGLGIDLTAGSVVIHYDRWWNAAREDQATDRVHRIGQMRGVQVFKLVTKGTFEERIDLLIRKKGSLMEDIIGADDHELIKKFDRNDLIQLLELHRPD